MGKITSSKHKESTLKGCAHFIFASLFFKSKREHLWNGKTFFISPQKLFSFSRKSNFKILDTQVSWHHQMPMHKTRNTFYWITWEINLVCWWNLASLCHITKKKFIKNLLKNFDLETSSRSFYFVLAKICISKTFKICLN